MSKRWPWIGLALWSLLSACGGGDGPAVDLTGTWWLTPITGEGEDDSIHMTLVQTGTSVDATATCNAEWPPGAGTWTGGVLSLAFDFGGGEVLELTGAADGADLAGTFTMSGSEGYWRLSRTSLALDCAHACDPVLVAPFVDTDFTDLSKIEEISLFRSSAGHDYSDGCETCRSMKHYFAPYLVWRVNGAIEIRSPVAGTIVSVTDEGHGASPPGINKQVHIRSFLRPDVTFILFHVDLASAAVVSGKVVSEGETIGHARMYYDDLLETAHDFDIAVRVATWYGPRYVSWFDVVTDSLFSTYVARGAAARSDFILTRAARDADPLTCSGETFTSTGVLPAWFLLTAP